LWHDNPENGVQITSQKHPAGMCIKSIFYFDLNGYFWFLSDLIDIFCAGELPTPVESRFDEEKEETDPVSGVFSIKKK
jgi:hypothetical protein